MLESNLTLVFMETAGSAHFTDVANWAQNEKFSHSSSDSWKVSNVNKVCLTPNSMSFLLFRWPHRSGRNQDGGGGIGVEKSIWEADQRGLNLGALHVSMRAT